MNSFIHNSPVGAFTRSTFVIDVDGVVCGPNKSEERIASYIDCEPLPEAVAKIRSLFRLGHRIIFHTSRNVNTFKGDENKLNGVTKPILKAWLKQHDIPYHEIVMGKPWGEGGVYYVDDRALTLTQFINSADKDDWDKHINENTV